MNDESVGSLATRSSRRATVRRRTSETEIVLSLDLDGVLLDPVDALPGATASATESAIATGLGFLDHMLASFARHSGFSLAVQCKGDLHIDDHHTVEDIALVLGEAFATALGDRRGIERFGDAVIVMDEARVNAAVDLSGRPFACIDLGLRRERLGDVACENLTHFFASFATASRNTVHIEVVRGENDHHRAEAAFKALARALRGAVRRTASGEVPSTKGVLS